MIFKSKPQWILIYEYSLKDHSRGKQKTIFTHRRVAKLENETICSPQNEFATICCRSWGAEPSIPDTWVLMCTPQHHGRISGGGRRKPPCPSKLDLDGATRVVANIWVASWQTSSSSSSFPASWKLKLCHLRALCVPFVAGCLQASCGLMTSPGSPDMQKFLTHRRQMLLLWG